MLVFLDEPFPRRRAKEEEESEEAGDDVIEEWLPRLAASENAVVLLAPGLAAAKAKKVGALAEKVYEFEERGAHLPAGRQGFNSALVNALAAGDGAKLWLELARALRAGDAPEQVHGLLHWKARDLMQKGKPGARELSLDLIRLLADARRKGLDLSESLERFALSR
jgi:hypothetical protein